MSDQTYRAIIDALVRSCRHGQGRALVVLHEAQLEPFDEGYEGTPFHDFVGRLTGWQWPSPYHFPATPIARQPPDQTALGARWKRFLPTRESPGSSSIGAVLPEFYGFGRSCPMSST